MATSKRKRRIPQLKYTTTRNIGWHCSYRDPDKGTPRKKVFGMVSRSEAEVAYHGWLAEHLGGARVVPEDTITPIPRSSSAAQTSTEPTRPKAIARRRSPNSKAPSPTAGGSGARGGECLEGCLLLVEFGSRQGTSIGDMKRWLGHSASSNMADTYMRPVSPEHRDVVEFVRSSLATPVQLSAA